MLLSLMSTSMRIRTSSLMRTSSSIPRFLDSTISAIISAHNPCFRRTYTFYLYGTLTFLSISGRSSRLIVCCCAYDGGGASGSKLTCCPALRRKPPATAAIRPLVSTAIFKGKLFLLPPVGPLFSSPTTSPGVAPPLANCSSSSCALSENKRSIIS